MITTTCLSCGAEIVCLRRSKKWCSQKCYIRYKTGYPKIRKCLDCGTEFQILTQRADANRKYCSDRCSKRANNRRTKQWIGNHPDAIVNYQSKRIEKYPGMWKE